MPPRLLTIFLSFLTMQADYPNIMKNCSFTIRKLESHREVSVEATFISDVHLFSSVIYTTESAISDLSSKCRMIYSNFPVGEKNSACEFFLGCGTEPSLSMKIKSNMLGKLIISLQLKEISGKKMNELHLTNSFLIHFSSDISLFDSFLDELDIFNSNENNVASLEGYALQDLD